MFSIRLKKLRTEKNITQKDLARYLGVSDRSVGYYETGQRTPPPDIIEKIADYFNVSVDYLLGRTDIRNPYRKEDKNLSNIDKFLQELKKKALERGIEFDENSIDDLLDLYEFIKNRDKKSN